MVMIGAFVRMTWFRRAGLTILSYRSGGRLGYDMMKRLEDEGIA